MLHETCHGVTPALFRVSETWVRLINGDFLSVSESTSTHGPAARDECLKGPDAKVQRVLVGGENRGRTEETSFCRGRH